MSQIALTFPNSSVRHYDKGVTVDQVAASIGSSLAKATLAGKFQGLCRSEERRVGKECRSRWSPYH